MHIMHLLTRLLRSGSEENTMETCRYQAQAGYRVTLVHGQEFDPYWYRHPIQGVELVSLPDLVHPMNLKQDFLAIRRMRRLLKAYAPDVLHTHQSKAGIVGRIASGVLPDVFVVHGIHILPFGGESGVYRQLYLNAERLAARYTDLFIGVSKAVGQAYIDEGLARPDQVVCVRSGMDLTRFEKGQWPEDWQSLLDIGAQETRPPVALMMAALEPRKRHAGFLKAFAKVKDKIPDLKIIFAGQGPEEENLRKLVAELEVQKHIVFAGHRPDPEALFALADVAVLTSNKEGLPRVLIQGLAAGVPSVLNDLPGLKEILEHGKNAVITKPDDLEQTVHSMMDLLCDPKALEKLRHGAARTDLSPWSLAALGPRTTALYKSRQSKMNKIGVAAE